MDEGHRPGRFRGFYINLDRSLARRQVMDEQLARLGLNERYARFPAIDKESVRPPSAGLTAGEVACFSSHTAVLRQAALTGDGVHVMEDDACLSPWCVPLLDQLCASGMAETVDVLFTETYVPMTLESLKRHKRLFDQSVLRDTSGAVTSISKVSLLELRKRVFAGMTSYWVAAKAVALLASMLEAELAQGPTLPVDLFVRKLIYEGVFRAKCIFPFTSSIRPDSIDGTTMPERGGHTLSVLATTLVRHSFFVGCDWRELERAAQRLYPGSPEDPHDRLIAAICRYMLVGDYKPF